MWTQIRILPRHRLTPSSVEVSIQPRSGRISFEPGQFVVLEVKLDAGIRRSAFSIVRAEGRGIILGVKQQGNGGISAWLNALDQPAKASMAGPFGQFKLNDAFEEHVFITGGSGITPIRSMLDILLEKRIVPTLIYANNRPEEAMYITSFRALAKEGAIKLVEVYDRDVARPIKETPVDRAAIYVCGPPGLMNKALEALEEKKVSEDRISTEKYGLDMGSNASAPLEFLWKERFRSARPIGFGKHKNILAAAGDKSIRIPHACEVGVCGTCRARVISGEVLCGQKVMRAGEEVLTCISQPSGNTPPTIGPMKGGRAELVTLFLLGAVMLIGLWSYPPAIGFKALGPMNTSHEELACNACHKEAPGSMRQQLGHNARSLLGMHPAEMVPVGFAPVDNAACLDCHNRPNDRHPVSRFMETRFAEQRATLGPHECNHCHGEHRDQRVAMVEPGFCVNCHQDTEVMHDTAEPSHAELFEQGAWETCLQCHDFHGNHLHEAPKKLADGIPQQTILEYLKGGTDPYGSDKTFTAEYP